MACQLKRSAMNVGAIMRRYAGVSALLLASPALGQRVRLTPADSALVGRILLAEDRRDSTSAALAEGERHRDDRIRLLAKRAKGRIRDSKFAARDSLPAPVKPPAYSEPTWR